MSYNARAVLSPDGSTSDFAIPFPYLSQTHVHVYLAGVEQVGFTFTNPTLLHMPSNPPAGSNTLVIQRITPAGSMLHTILNGTILPADINVDDLQLLYIGQENADQDTLALRVTDRGLAAFPVAATRATKYAAFDGSGDATLSGLSVATIEAAVTAYLSGASNLGNKFAKVFSLSNYISLGKTLAQCDTDCFAANGVMAVEANYALPGNVALSSKAVWFLGGEIDLSGHSITFNGCTIHAGSYKIFTLNGGSLLGEITNVVLYPEWLGALKGANPVITRQAIQALENFQGQSSSIGTRQLLFQPYPYQIDQPITNPTLGKALAWKGQQGFSGGGAATTISNTARTQVRIMTGNGPASGFGTYNSGLVFQGATAGGATSCLEIRDWCSNEYEDMLFDQNAIGVQVNDFAAGGLGFAENVKGRRNVYGYGLTQYGIRFVTTSGTASFRGFSETDFLFSRSASAPVTATTFMRIEAGGSFLYGGTLEGVISNLTNQAMWVIDCQSFGCFFKKSSFDFEQSVGGSITVQKTNGVMLGGHYSANGTNGNIRGGGAIFDCTSILDAIHNVNRGWSKIDPYVITGHGAPFVLPMQVIGDTFMHVQFKIDDGFSFMSYVDATIYLDNIGTAHQVVRTLTSNLYNALGITFDNSKISVSAGGQLTFDLNLGGNSAQVSGTVDYFGGQVN